MNLDALRTRILATLDRFSWVGPLAVRLSLGAVFLGTGWGKVHNLAQVTSFFTELGIPFPAAQATIVSGIELVGGTLIILGLFTRFAALPLLGTMVVAILTAKRPEIEGIRSLLAFEESHVPRRASSGCSSPVPGRRRWTRSSSAASRPCPARCFAPAGSPPSSAEHRKHASSETGLARCRPLFFCGVAGTTARLGSSSPVARAPSMRRRSHAAGTARGRRDDRPTRSLHVAPVRAS